MTQARIVLKHGSRELIDTLRRGDIPIRTAYKNFLKERGKELDQAV
jgi:hypothetical protein